MEDPLTDLLPAMRDTYKNDSAPEHSAADTLTFARAVSIRGLAYSARSRVWPFCKRFCTTLIGRAKTRLRKAYVAARFSRPDETKMRAAPKRSGGGTRRAHRSANRLNRLRRF
jgi:hypothetical protein